MSETATGAAVMARTKAKPKASKAAETTGPAPRTTIINLKGSEAQATWMENIHRKTHIAKSVIMRLALTEWAVNHGHDPFPTSDDDQ